MIPALGEHLVTAGDDRAEGTAGTGEHLFAGQADGTPQVLQIDCLAGGFWWVCGHGWLPRKDSNLEREIQNLLCYHYTTG